jgi:hydantoinase/carbamoylase family amidase
MSNHLQRANKVLDRINELASISDDKNCIARTYGTPAFIEGRNRLQQWMEEAGLQTSIDTIGNLRARVLSKNASAKTFVIASHIDTVINAGRFDGPLGVLIGLDLLDSIVRSKTELPFHVELIAFCDEEGCRFHTTYLGSKAVAGSFDEVALKKKDDAGVSLEELIRQQGGNVNKLSKDAIAREDWLGYFEIHIEQGPVLYEKNIPVGIVTAIAGQRRAEIIFKGEAGHAGTVPMNMRKDALACAALFVLTAEAYSKDISTNLVATVGKLNIVNAASNVVPGEVNCSLDIRHADEAVLSSSYDEIKQLTESICRKRNIEMTWNLVQQGKPVTCDINTNKLLAQSIAESGYEVVEMVSGAGHDAVPVSEVSPVSMLFVRCYKGISHNPAENVELTDIAAAIKVSDNFIRRLINS